MRASEKKYAERNLQKKLVKKATNFSVSLVYWFSPGVGRFKRFAEEVFFLGLKLQMEAKS